MATIVKINNWTHSKELRENNEKVPMKHRNLYFNEDEKGYRIEERAYEDGTGRFYLFQPNGKKYAEKGFEPDDRQTILDNLIDTVTRLESLK